MKLGRVKWFNAQKGYGFIEPDEGGADLFVHHSEVVPQAGYSALIEGQTVKFDLGEGPKGPCAQRVERPNTT